MDAMDYKGFAGGLAMIKEEKERKREVLHPDYGGGSGGV